MHLADWLNGVSLQAVDIYIYICDDGHSCVETWNAITSRVAPGDTQRLVYISPHYCSIHTYVQ